MTRKSLMTQCSLGVFIWTLLAYAIQAHTHSWAVTGQYMVYIVIGVLLLGAIWLGVERDQQRLDEQERREKEALGFYTDDADEYEAPRPPSPKRAA